MFAIMLDTENHNCFVWRDIQRIDTRQCRIEIDWFGICARSESNEAGKECCKNHEYCWYFSAKTKITKKDKCH